MTRSGPPRITMTSFGAFVVADPASQLAKLREIKRRYEQPYTRGSDYWQRFIEYVQKRHRAGVERTPLDALVHQVPADRTDQYRSACAGYAKFWGRKDIRLLKCATPALWTCDRLRVNVNPEWWLSIDGRKTLVKLHTTRDMELAQRLANPLLCLLEECFPGEHDVIVLDLHRGKAWRRRSQRDLVTVLQMQAAAFLAGWDLLTADSEAA